MNKKIADNRIKNNKRSGVVLLLTLIIMVVLATLTYSLTTRVASQKHRNNYIIDYQSARYACDSAIKYAIATMEDINIPALIERPNVPDFSDLFALDDEQYRELLEDYSISDNDDSDQFSIENNRRSEMDLFSDINDINDINDISKYNKERTEDKYKVPGPYGPRWPYLKEPIELEIGTTKIRIEIEDEQAKYPIAWALLSDKKIRREAIAGFETFCEWMDINEVQIDELSEQLEYISTLKTFKMQFKAVTQKKTTTTRSSRRRRTRRSRRTTTKTETIAQAVVHTADFARLFHSSLIEHDILAKRTIESEDREISALKYISLWGTNKININTAPRHVLETAFVFGGDSVKIAEEIIELRRIKPFSNYEELEQKLFKYSDSLEKSRGFITMQSDFFTIRVTAISGNAKASAVIAVRKVKGKLQRIAVISG